MKVLIHTCCVPCSIYCVETLQKENIEVTAFWYNPNIHLKNEYEKRKNTLIEYSKTINLNVIYKDIYGLKEFIKNTVENIDKRCDYCYKTRLEQTAKTAKENGFDGFSTTLLVSPYQNHEKLIEIANEMSKKYEIEFLYRDFRIGFREGQKKAKELDLYRQKYCGCVFSEEERYL